MAKKQDIKLVAPEAQAPVAPQPPVGELEAAAKKAAEDQAIAEAEAAAKKAAEDQALADAEAAAKKAAEDEANQGEESEESNLDIAEQMVSATKEFYMGIFGELTATMFEPLKQVIKEARFKAGEIDGTEDKIQKEDLDDMVQSNLDLANEALARLNGEL
jgi:colicin import membrane protein